MAAARDDFDNPWKEMLEHAFPELMAFYLPDAHARIDWTCEHVFLNTELRRVVRDAELGKRFADVLVLSVGYARYLPCRPSTLPNAPRLVLI